MATITIYEPPPEEPKKDLTVRSETEFEPSHIENDGSVHANGKPLGDNMFTLYGNCPKDGGFVQIVFTLSEVKALLDTAFRG